MSDSSDAPKVFLLRIRPGLDSDADILVELDLTRPIVLGRQQDCDLVLDNQFISRRHARFFEVNGDVYVEDLQSFNGTAVDRKRIWQATPVEPGAAIQIGPLLLQIEIGAAEESLRVTQGQPRIVPLESA